LERSLEGPDDDITVALRGMHDLVLNAILVEWEEARVTISLRSREPRMKLVAEGLVSLDIPQRKYWGPSVSVMAAFGPFAVESKQKEVRIEMQSGMSSRSSPTALR
jgi:hypothetical protein